METLPDHEILLTGGVPSSSCIEAEVTEWHACAAQEALQAYQRHFLWSEGAEGGVLMNIERELSIRAAMITDTPHSVFS